MSVNSTTLKWNQDEALKCKDSNVFMNNIYGKFNIISIRKYNFYWLRNKNFIFLDYIIENDEKVYIRIADDIEVANKLFLELGKSLDLIEKYAITEKNSGYKYFCNKELQFLNLNMDEFSHAEEFKNLMIECLSNSKKFINMTEIKTIEDILYLGNNLKNAKRISIVGKNLPKTILNKRAVRPNMLRDKIKDALDNGNLIDVSNYDSNKNDLKIISSDVARNNNLIFSEKIGIASNNKENFKSAYKDSYFSEQRMSEEYSSDYDYILSLFDEKDSNNIIKNEKSKPNKRKRKI